MTERPEWADWLREQFDRHPTIRINADLSRAGGKKSNGRPLIDPSRITQWLRGQRPSYELAQATARAFGADEIAALRAAGYVTGHGPITVTTNANDPGSVGPSSQDAEALRFQRPPGLSDDEWDDLRRQQADYWEYLVSKAAKER